MGVVLPFPVAGHSPTARELLSAAGAFDAAVGALTVARYALDRALASASDPETRIYIQRDIRKVKRILDLALKHGCITTKE